MDDLFNTVIAACGNPMRGFALKGDKDATQKKEFLAATRGIRQQLLGTQRFQICDSLLNHAVHASMVRPQILLDMFEIAVPPFQNMWIEWNEEKRIDLIRAAYDQAGWDYDNNPKIYSRGVSRLGLHIHAQGDNSNEWHVDQYAIVNSSELKPDDKKYHGKIAYPPFSIQFRPDGPLQIDNSRLMAEGGMVPKKDQQKELRSKQHFDGPELFGQVYVDNHQGTKRQKHFTDLFERVILSMNSMSKSIMLNVWRMQKYGNAAERAEGNNTARELQNESIKCWEGDIRFLVATLSLLNYPHNIIQRKLEMGVKRIAYGRSVPRNEIRTLEIDLPKPRGTTRYERMFKGGGGKKRRHVRRGHWHTFIYKGGERKVKWVEEKWVGDASLGTITHDYELKSKQSR